MTYAFFSYSRRDEAFTLALAQDLRRHGVQIWMDQLDIAPGTNWDEAVQRALQNCSTVLFVASEHSVQSNNVLNELSWAIEHKHKVIPLVISNGITIPMQVIRLQRIDFSKNHTRGLVQLLALLRSPGSRTEAISQLRAPTLDSASPSPAASATGLEAASLSPVRLSKGSRAARLNAPRRSTTSTLLLGAGLGAAALLAVVIAVATMGKADPSVDPAPLEPASPAAAPQQGDHNPPQSGASAPPLPNDTPKTRPSPAAPQLTETGNDAPAFLGSWLSACLTAADGSHARSMYTFTKSTAHLRVTQFGDPSCNQALIEVNATAKYLTSARADGAYNLDMLLQSAVLTPVAFAARLNAEPGVGYRNWQDGVPRELTRAEIASFTGYAPDAGDSRYNIVLVQGNHLYMGAGNASLTPEARPERVNMSLPYLRVGAGVLPPSRVN